MTSDIDLSPYVDRLLDASKADTDYVVRDEFSAIVNELAERVRADTLERDGEPAGFRVPLGRDALYFITHSGLFIDLSHDDAPTFPISERAVAILTGLLDLAQARAAALRAYGTSRESGQ